MKTSILCAALLTAFSLPGAQAADVRILGSLDMGVMARHADGETTATLESGMNKTSFIDFRVREEIRPGLNLGLYLSETLYMDSGVLADPDTLFDFSELSLHGSWGSVWAGRLGSLKNPDGDMSTFALTEGFTPMGSNLPNTGLGGIFLTDGILSNALGYRSPDWNGYRMSVQYSNGVAEEVGRAAEDDRHLSASIAYNRGGKVRWGVIATRRTHNTLHPGKAATKDITASVNVDFSALRLYVTYQHVWDGVGPNTILRSGAFGFGPLGGGFSTDALLVGASVPLSGGTLGTVLQGSRTKYEGPVSDGGRRTGWRINPAAIYRHPLSKRTTLWTAASWSHGWGVWRRVSDEAYDQPNVTTWGAGITHTF